MMRVAVVDIGTNSTRLLIADVHADGSIDELERRTSVTRLGAGVDASGALSAAAMGRVHAVLDEYARDIDARDVNARTGVLTSAVRDASNGPQFVAAVQRRHHLDARVIPGAEEAQLTFLGAMSDRDPGDSTPTLVIDVGGGSTELVLGAGGGVDFFVSLQAGVVRQSERHLHDDPPSEAQLLALRADVRSLIMREVPTDTRRRARRALAVAGTATSCAAIDQALEPYDSTRVQGYRLGLDRLAAMLEHLRPLALPERRAIAGLHPDRAPTIVSGIAILIEVIDAFGLQGFEASEHDILRGAAMRRAGLG